MKLQRIFIMLIIFAFTMNVFADVPEKMSYQAIIRDSEGTLMTEHTIALKVSILPNSVKDSPVFVEVHYTLTNVNGLASIEIGDGIVSEGVFDKIDWSLGTYFIKTEVDLTGAGDSYDISATSQLLSVPYALYAGNVKTYSIGDFAHGGVVFWVDETGQHGLVCAKVDQSDGIRWHAGTNGMTHANGDGLYAGRANTSIIIAAQVAIGDDGVTFAARLCNALQITENGVTYSDWYLPSFYELDLMYQSKSEIDETAVFYRGTAISTKDSYWSSCENSAGTAKGISFIIGAMTGTPKSNIYGNVRAVRAF